MCQELWGPHIPGLRSNLESRAHLFICPTGSCSHRHPPLPGTWSPGAPPLLPLHFLFSSQDIPLRNVFQQRLTTGDFCPGGSLCPLLDLGQEGLAFPSLLGWLRPALRVAQQVSGQAEPEHGPLRPNTLGIWVRRILVWEGWKRQGAHDKFPV